ncbi:MAG: hypothetical protein V1858_01090 [Candidatus Gottesmanbacteria bacterium]
MIPNAERDSLTIDNLQNGDVVGAVELVIKRKTNKCFLVVTDAIRMREALSHPAVWEVGLINTPGVSILSEKEYRAYKQDLDKVK